MPALPVEILRLILACLTQDGGTADELNHKASARSPKASGRSALHSCCLVNRLFLLESQPLLHQSLHIKTQEGTNRWLEKARAHGHLAKYIKRLHLVCSQAENGIGSILQATFNLRCLILDVTGIEKRECLAESVNLSIRRCEKIESITLIGLTSIKSLSVIYNLPYRLKVLGITGLYNYKGALWDNSQDSINAERIIFSGAKLLDNWDMYFLFQLFEIAPARPPTRLHFHHCQISFEFLPESTCKAVKEIVISEAPQLLELGELDNFSNLSALSFGSEHDFVKLCRPLPAIRRLYLTSCNEPTCTILLQWLSHGYFPNVNTISMQKGNFDNFANGVSWLEELKSVCPDVLVRFSSHI